MATMDSGVFCKNDLAVGQTQPSSWTPETWVSILIDGGSTNTLSVIWSSGKASHSTRHIIGRAGNRSNVRGFVSALKVKRRLWNGRFTIKTHLLGNLRLLLRQANALSSQGAPCAHVSIVVLSFLADCFAVSTGRVPSNGAGKVIWIVIQSIVANAFAAAVFDLEVVGENDLVVSEAKTSGI